jgi:type II secretory pathway component PulL
LKRNEHKLDVSIREVLQSTLPGEASTPDARKLMEQKLAAARTGASSGLLTALEALVQARSAAPGALVQALSYRNNGSVDLKIAAPDAASLDRIGQALRNNGWQADLTSGNNVANGYEGRLQIHPNGS